MSHALRELGLGPDADERAVKRAYAARLKTTRPDRDPEGFQALNATYQAAMAWVLSRSDIATGPTSITADADADADANIDTDTDTACDAREYEPPFGTITHVLSEQALFDMLDAQPIDATDDDPPAIVDSSAVDPGRSSERFTVEAVHFDLETLLDDCIAAAVHGRDGELPDWLNAQPVLWSLPHKAQIAQWLLRHLHAQCPPIEARRFDVLADFFALFDLHSGYDAYVIQRLRHRMHLAWEVQTEQYAALAKRCMPDGGSFAADLRQTRRIMVQLRRPLKTMQALFAGLLPMYPTAVRRFLHRLDFGNLEDLPQPIDPAQIAFWDAAGDRSHFSKPRWAVSAARVVVYTLAVTLAYVLSDALREPSSVGSVLFAMDWPTVAAMTFATLSALWLGYLAHSAFNQWQALPESEPVRMPWLRTLSIPLLGLGILVADQIVQLDAGGVALAMVLLMSALYRYRRRSGVVFAGKIQLKIWQLSVLLCALVLLGTLLDGVLGFLTLVIVGTALVLWAVDMRKQRSASET